MKLNINKDIYLKNLIELYHPKSAKSIIEKTCDQKLAETLNPITSLDVTLEKMYIPTEVLLNDLHYSWLNATIDSMPKHLQPLLIGALSKHQRRGIASMKNNIELEKIKTYSLTRKFFQQSIREVFEQERIFNIHFLPQKPLSILLTLNKSILIEMLDLIGLYDLAAKMKTIIDRKTISSIHSAFSDKKRQFLQAILNDKKKGSCI